LMRNGRDRRSGNPRSATRGKNACFCLGPISGSHQGQRPKRLHPTEASPPLGNRPDTWLHPNESQECQILLLHRGRRPYRHVGSSASCAARPWRTVAQRRHLGGIVVVFGRRFGSMCSARNRSANSATVGMLTLPGLCHPIFMSLAMDSALASSPGLAVQAVLNEKTRLRERAVRRHWKFFAPSGSEGLAVLF
jgi:hypothetical protein